MRRQFDLFAAGTRARSSDPETSFAAAERVGEFAPTHQERILNCLRERGPMTFYGIAEWLDMDYAQIHKRLPELRRMGLIAVVQKDGQDVTRIGPTGRECRLWTAV